jgi:hypothetical protein
VAATTVRGCRNGVCIFGQGTDCITHRIRQLQLQQLGQEQHQNSLGAAAECVRQEQQQSSSRRLVERLSFRPLPLLKPLVDICCCLCCCCCCCVCTGVWGFIKAARKPAEAVQAPPKPQKPVPRKQDVAKPPSKR